MTKQLRPLRFWASQAYHRNTLVCAKLVSISMNRKASCKKAAKYYVDGRHRAPKIGRTERGYEKTSILGFFEPSKVQRKNQDPTFLIGNFSSNRETSLEILMKKFKLVILQIYEFKNIDGSFITNYGLSGLSRFGSEEKHLH